MMFMFQEDMMIVTPYDELRIDGISSPIAAHILDFCDDGSGGDLFAAVNAASDMFTASSEDASSSSTATPPGPCSHGGDNVSSPPAPAPAPDQAASAFSSMPSFDSTLSALLEDDEPPGTDAELLLPIDYAFAAAAGEEAPPEQQQQQQFGQASLPAATAEHPALQTQMSSSASELMNLASAGYSDECFAATMAGAGGGYVGLDDALCQPPPPPPGALLPAGLADAAAQGPCFFGKDAAQGAFFGSGACSNMAMSMMVLEEIGEYQRMMEGAGAGAMVATHTPDADAAAQMPFAGSAAEMQMGGSRSPGRAPATAMTTAETPSLEDASFKGVRLSGEQRREKIHRYIKKRNERNFSKKIKYACRKTLADSRPRVRGRFAKNDDYGEPSRGMQSNDECEQIDGIKGEDMLDSDALQAHLGGMNMNSYMYNHTVESWI
ncbi:hypothetical protein ACP4OV_010645 [Aristida adscensionis]